jgi:hypothetical protein
MRYFTSLPAQAGALIFAFLVTGAMSSPIDTSAAAPRDEETANIFKRGLCTGTGPGVCNLGVATWDYPDIPDIVTSVSVFDRWCNRIGAQPYPTASQCFYSQLPYSVCMDELDAASRTIVFRYAGQTISSRNGQCSCSDSGGTRCWVNGIGYSGTHCCQCAFNC